MFLGFRLQFLPPSRLTRLGDREVPLLRLPQPLLSPQEGNKKEPLAVIEIDCIVVEFSFYLIYLAFEKLLMMERILGSVMANFSVPPIVTLFNAYWLCSYALQ